MQKKPSKPWRVTVTGPDVTATSPFTSQAKTYDFIHAALTEGSGATAAKVEQWEGGRWHHFETVTAEEIQAAARARAATAGDSR